MGIIRSGSAIKIPSAQAGVIPILPLSRISHPTPAPHAGTFRLSMPQRLPQPLSIKTAHNRWMLHPHFRPKTRNRSRLVDTRRTDPRLLRRGFRVERRWRVGRRRCGAARWFGCRGPGLSRDIATRRGGSGDGRSKGGSGRSAPPSEHPAPDFAPEALRRFARQTPLLGRHTA